MHHVDPTATLALALLPVCLCVCVCLLCSRSLSCLVRFMCRLADPHIVQHIGHGASTWQLILALDYERHNTASPWKPYIASLKKPDSPLWWSEEELGAFQSDAIVGEIQVRRVSRSGPALAFFRV